MSQRAQHKNLNEKSGGSQQSLPIFLDLRDRRCLVIGGGEAAVAKVRQLFDAGAKITVVAEEVLPTLIDWAIGEAIILHQHALSQDDVTGTFLAFITLADESEQAAAATMARQGGALVNVVDAPAACDFIMPAHVDRGALTVAIGTQGLAPGLAVKLRQELDAVLPERLGDLVDFAGRYRDAVKLTTEGPHARRRFWQDFFDGPVAEAVLAGDEALAFDGMLKAINRPNSSSRQGRLTLIQSPGFDTDLLTVGALRRLYRADYVAYHGDTPRALLQKNRRDADVTILDGVESDGVRLLKERAASGARVVIVSDDTEFLADIAFYLNPLDNSYRLESFESGRFLQPAETLPKAAMAHEVGGVS